MFIYNIFDNTTGKYDKKVDEMNEQQKRDFQKLLNKAVEQEKIYKNVQEQGVDNRELIKVKYLLTVDKVDATTHE